MSALLDVVRVGEIVASGEALAAHVGSLLRRDGGLWIEHRDLHESYAASMAAGKEFFALAVSQKNEVDGAAFFRAHHNDRRADFLGKERGWSRSGARAKEYFQYGPEVRRGDESFIPNIWPTGDFGREFRLVKLDHLARLCAVHRAMFGVLGSVLNKDKIAESPDSILCRDSHFLPTTQSSVVRNKAHVDLCEGTLIHVEPGLQLYQGEAREPADVVDDAAGWQDVSGAGLLFIPGLALEIRTGGALRATWHRVVSRVSAEQSRYSIVSFGHADVDDVLGPDLVPRGHEPARHYEPISREQLTVMGGLEYLRA